VKLLHTSDWHVGKAIRGHSRAGEHRAVLADIADVAETEAVDLVLVAGDLFDTAAPTAESERIVYDALLRLAEVAPVLLIAGNHDSARRLDAVARLLALGRITVAATPRAPADGGVTSLELAGTPVQVALLPFVSQRAIVRADALMDTEAFRNAQTYSQRMRVVIAALTAGFSADSVNVLLAHAFVIGGVTGGGERPAHVVDEYAISAVDLPVTASYVALGHLHRAQAISGATSIHYCGSPLQLDFGERSDAKQVNIVDVEPGLPAKVKPVLLTSGDRLLTLTGTVAQLAGLASSGDLPDGAWIRAVVTEQSRAGLADEVRDALGERVVDVRLDAPDDRRRPRRSVDRATRTPAQQFAAYLDERDVDDPRLQRAFEQLFDELSTPDEPAPAQDRAPTDPEASGAGASKAQQLSLGT
jgi:exonuclease SbcD